MGHFPSFIFRMWDTLVFSTLGLMQLDSWRLMFSCSLDRGEQYKKLQSKHHYADLHCCFHTNLSVLFQQQV